MYLIYPPESDTEFQGYLTINHRFDFVLRLVCPLEQLDKPMVLSLDDIKAFIHLRLKRGTSDIQLADDEMILFWKLIIPMAKEARAEVEMEEIINDACYLPNLVFPVILNDGPREKRFNVSPDVRQILNRPHFGCVLTDSAHP